MADKKETKKKDRSKKFTWELEDIKIVKKTPKKQESEKK